ncbi:MAG: bifunctional serine/threonine-protein kinase/formylglycine-generating enzyme family protein [Prosthecobacter sp.]
MVTCPRCGKPQPERTLVGGLCASCVAESMKVDLLSLNEPQLEEKEPLSIQVQGYEIQALIGGGGMGEVYRAVDLDDGEIVALKVVAGRLTRDPEVMARFETEVAALAQLDHPNVVRVLDHGETANGRQFLVMEYVDGCDLRRFLRAQRPDMERAFDIFAKVCAGVAHAHERGLAHRDIKPANILIGHEGAVKVADFGLAKTLTDTVAGYSFTQTRDTFGTPYYVAPEVARNAGAADERSDVYALGVLLYELLTGAVPMGQFTPLSEKTGLDRRIDAIVSHALADDPERRLRSVKELAAAVAQTAEEHRLGHVRQRRRLRLLAAAAIVTILGVGASVGAWYADKQNEGSKPAHRPPTTATHEDPWTNSIGMKFVPVPKTNVLFSIWETRVRDFEAFFKADTAVLPDWRTGANDNRLNLKKPATTKTTPEGKVVPAYNWRNPGPGFEQTLDHPVCGVLMLNMRMFCAWLTWKDRMEGRIGDDQRYRLPTSDEWSHASGRRDKTAESRAMLDALEAGDSLATANFAGPEVIGPTSWEGYAHLERRDPFPRTAPVGSFAPNAHGIYDMSGNLIEWTDTEAPADPEKPKGRYYYIRGGSWGTGSGKLCRLEHRKSERFGTTGPTIGFRIVLDLKAAPAEPQEMGPFVPELKGK